MGFFKKNQSSEIQEININEVYNKENQDSENSQEISNVTNTHDSVTQDSESAADDSTIQDSESIADDSEPTNTEDNSDEIPVNKKSKKKLIITILIIALLSAILIIYITSINYGIEIKDKYLNNGITIELGEKEISEDASYYLSKNEDEDKIDETKVDISNVDTSKEGKYEIILTYKEKEYIINVTVEDTIAPTIKGSDSSSIKGNGYSEEDLLALFTVKDKSKFTLEIETDYDGDTKGDYIVKAIATDKADNVSELEITVSVTETFVDTSPTKGISVDPEDALMYVSKTSEKLSSSYVPTNLVSLGSYATRSMTAKSVTKSAYINLYEAALKDGITYKVVSAYRDYDLQSYLYNSSIANNGYEYAIYSSAEPGRSEHQTGYALDVSTSGLNYTLTESMGNMPEGKWLSENAHKYGFIVRYPDGKTSITGYSYEPWHIRYVGVSAATAMYNSGQTFEEYLGKV